MGTPWGTPVTIEYSEGAEIGYRWFARQHQEPLYAFGHGLSYTTFGYSNLQAEGGDTITAGAIRQGAGQDPIPAARREAATTGLSGGAHAISQ